jgi:CBS domain containing-hemolysin-like protein
MGRTRLAELNDRLGLSFESKDHDTLGGLMFELLGRTVKTGARVTTGGSELTLVKREGRRISQVLIKRLPEESDADS